MDNLKYKLLDDNAIDIGVEGNDLLGNEIYADMLVDIEMCIRDRYCFVWRNVFSCRESGIHETFPNVIQRISDCNGKGTVCRAAGTEGSSDDIIF